MKKIVIIVFIALVAALGAMKLMAEKKKIQEQATPLSLSYSIKTTTPQQKKVDEKRSFLASVKSDKEIQVMTKLSGAITKLYVSESDEVKKGDLLVEIDDSNLMSTLKTLEKTLEVQESDLTYYQSVQDRNEKLYQANAISKEKYDASKLQLLSKKASLEATKDKITSINSDLKYLQVRAPFNGVVSSIYMHKGDLATAQKPILSLSAKKQKMTFMFANTKDSITIGNPVDIEDQEVGVISKIYPNAKNNLNVAEVKLSKILHLRNDSYLSIDVVTNTRIGCTLPLNAILHTKDANYILVYDKDHFAKQKVDIIIENQTEALIEPCTTLPVALASESKLSILPFYKNIKLVGESDEK
jgi:RND family efflux transporter MFP subunit